jgi:hypothetical protein
MRATNEHGRADVRGGRVVRRWVFWRRYEVFLYAGTFDLTFDRASHLLKKFCPRLRLSLVIPTNATTVNPARAPALKTYFGLHTDAELVALYHDRYRTKLTIKKDKR